MIFEFIKDGIRFFCKPAIFLLNFYCFRFKIKFIFIDESRFGHLIGDSLILLKRRNNEFQYILPYYKPCNYQYINFLNQLIVCRKSLLLRKLIGFLRHENFVINVTYYINYVYDYYNFKKISFKPKYTINEVSFGSINIFESYKEYFVKKYCNNFICVTYRNGLANPDTEYLHSFRNSNRDTFVQILKYLEKKDLKIINISDDFIDDVNVINMKFISNYEEFDSILAICFSDIFIGDSSGPSVIAQILRIKSIIFNAFPPSIDVTNSDSQIIHKKILNANNMHEANKMIYNRDLINSGLDICDNSFEDIKILIDKVFERHYE